jgi:hypothetical protein
MAASAMGLAISCGDDSGGTPEEDEGATRRRVAQALTDGIDFDNGSAVLEPMPETTDEDLVIEQDDAPIALDPGTAALLPFDIENPDEDDPVVATLLQFEEAGEDEHIEVDLELADGATMAEVMMDVADDVCDDFCADSFAVKLIQALKTRGGRIGARITRNLRLTCAEDGENAMCESAAGDGDGPAPGDGDGDGDGDTTGGLDLRDSFRNAVTAVNDTLCECSGLPEAMCTDNHWISPAEQECVETALEDSANATNNVRQLLVNLPLPNTLSSIRSACDPSLVFGIALPNAPQQVMPAAITDCDTDGVNTFTVPSADAGVAPAP